MVTGQRGNSKLTMIARRTIHPGEELTITYVNYNMPRSDRRAMLRELYGFWCNCPRCIREEGKEGDDPEGMMQKSRENAQEMIEKMKLMPGFEQTRDGVASAGEVKPSSDEKDDLDGTEKKTDSQQQLISGWSPDSDDGGKTVKQSEEVHPSEKMEPR